MVWMSTKEKYLNKMFVIFIKYMLPQFRLATNLQPVAIHDLNELIYNRNITFSVRLTFESLCVPCSLRHFQCIIFWIYTRMHLQQAW